MRNSIKNTQENLSSTILKVGKRLLVLLAYSLFKLLDISFSLMKQLAFATNNKLKPIIQKTEEFFYSRAKELFGL